MKRKLGIIVTALALVAVMLVGLCACGSTWSKIKSAYKSEGYHEVELTDKLKEGLGLTDEMLDEYGGTLHIMTTATLSEEPTVEELASLMSAKTVMILEYDSVDALKAKYKEAVPEEQQDEFDKLWEDLQKRDNVNENCMLVEGDEEIFKGTK